MINAVDKVLARALRTLPDVRGKAPLALRWKRLRERSRPLDGFWELRMADGSIISAPLGSSMTWTIAAVGHWDRQILELVSRYVAPESLVLDVGASLGLWTVPLGRAARLRGTILWSFEPNPENARWLAANIERNGLRDVVEFRAFGLGARAGTAHLLLREHGGGNGALSEQAGQDSVPVFVVRLDDLDLPRRVSFMKLDVEGFELEVLRGAHATIERDRPAIFGEFSAEWLKIRGEDLASYLGFLAELDYQVFAVDEYRSAFWRPRDLATLRRQEAPFSSAAQNLLLVPATSPSS